MKNNIFIKTYTFSDLFDNTFKMLKHTWKNSVIVSSLAFMPVAFLTVLLSEQYFKKILSISEMDFNTQSQEILLSFLPVIGIFSVLSLLIGIFHLFAGALITTQTFKVIREEPVQLKELIFTVLKEKFGKLLFQVLLLAGVVAVFILAASITISLLTALFNLLIPSLSIFIAVLSGITAFCIFIWLIVSFSFITEELLFTDTSVPRTLLKSIQLVKGNWWRVCGISILFQIVLSFAISMVISPVTFLFMAPYTEGMMKSLVSNSSGIGISKEFVDFFSNMKFPFFLSAYLSSILTMLFSPVFKALFYVDLKYRKKELNIEEPPVDPGSYYSASSTDTNSGAENENPVNEDKDSNA